MIAIRIGSGASFGRGEEREILALKSIIQSIEIKNNELIITPKENLTPRENP